MLLQTIPRSWNGGRQGGRRSIGRELPWVEDRPPDHCDEQGDHNKVTVSIIFPNIPINETPEAVIPSPRGIAALHYQWVLPLPVFARSSSMRFDA